MSANTMIPVLVYGPRKSGSTLLQRMLDGGSLMALAGETKLKRWRDFAMWDADVRRARAFEIFRVPPDIDGFDLASYQGLIEKEVGTVEDVGDFIDLDVRANLAGYGRNSRDFAGWVIKEVGGKPAQVLERFWQAFPAGKVILLFRDPAYVSRAVYRDRRRKGKDLSFSQMMKQARDPWKMLYRQLPFAQHPQVCRVEYEELTRDPEAVMRRIVDFLEIPFDPVFLAPTVNGKKWVVHTASQQTDQVFHVKQALRKGLTWKEWVIIRWASWTYGRRGDA